MGECGRVLIVEDDAGVRALVEGVLEDEGYEVRTATNGLQALDVLSDWRPHAIVLDFVMYDMDGPAFRAAQAARGIAPDVPVLLTSATRAEELPAAARRLRVDAYLAKPFELETFLALVADLTRRGAAESTPPTTTESDTA